MTQEEKLEEAKRLYETANADQKYVLERLFPELAESEDEKIRLKLIEAVKGDMVIGGTKDKQLAIAWLEKQGEQKSIENINGEDYGIDGLWHAQHILERTLGKVEGYQSDDGILEHECAISAVKSMYEQKPAWSKQDETMLGEIIDFFENGTVKLQHDLSLYASYLKSLKERYTWKPSDEQLEALSIAMCGVDDPLFSLYQDLKKLKG